MCSSDLTSVTSWLSITDAEVAQEYRQRNEKVKLDLVTLTADKFRNDVTVTDADLAKRFEGAGVAAIIFTDIARDGMLQGVNVEATAALARAVAIPVIASGGVNGVRDIELLASSGAPIEGVVIGRALYDGRIEPKAALVAARR